MPAGLPARELPPSVSILFSPESLKGVLSAAQWASPARLGGTGWRGETHGWYVLVRYLSGSRSRPGEHGINTYSSKESPGAVPSSEREAISGKCMGRPLPPAVP